MPNSEGSRFAAGTPGLHYVVFQRHLIIGRIQVVSGTGRYQTCPNPVSRAKRCVEYWEYLPDSRTAHTHIPAFDGYHRDDWEGVIVKLRDDGTVVGARASAHLGWNGRHPWWELRSGDWAGYPATVYRASGSHAGSLRQVAIDLAGDRWDGSLPQQPPQLLPADQARRRAPDFDPGATPPWSKQVWSDPEAVTTGPPGSRATYARYARWWSDLCLLC